MICEAGGGAAKSIFRPGDFIKLRRFVCVRGAT